MFTQHHEVSDFLHVDEYEAGKFMADAMGVDIDDVPLECSVNIHFNYDRAEPSVGVRAEVYDIEIELPNGEAVWQDDMPEYLYDQVNKILYNETGV